MFASEKHVHIIYTSSNFIWLIQNRKINLTLVLKNNKLLFVKPKEPMKGPSQKSLALLLISFDSIKKFELKIEKEVYWHLFGLTVIIMIIMWYSIILHTLKVFASLFLSLNLSTCQIWKNVFHCTWKTVSVLKKIKF